MSTAAASQGRWIYGPARDLLLGCGLGYAMLLALFVYVGAEFRSMLTVGGVAFLALLATTPHYGATLLRVYERRADRHAYSFFTVWATLGLAVLFLAGLRFTAVGTLLVTIYLTWSPWHYSGQNYGIAVMFLRRRGVPISDAFKRCLHASFILSFVLTLLSLHAESPQVAYGPGAEPVAGYSFQSLQIPGPIHSPLTLVVGAAYLLSLAFAGRLALRVASLRDLTPSIAIVVTQALWFSVPFAIRQLGILDTVDPFSPDHFEYYFYWIVIGHSVQYLWITSYYAARAEGWRGQFHYELKAMLAGAAAATLPAFVVLANLFEAPSYHEGLSVLTLAMMNLHHFVLDGAIWKLRDGPVARILIRGGSPGEPSRPLVSGYGARIGRVSAWGIGIACFTITALSGWEGGVVLPRSLERGDLPRAERALDRVAWTGRDNADFRFFVGNQYLTQGAFDSAARNLRRSLDLEPSVHSWLALGIALDGQLAWPEAREAYEAALTLSPEHPGVLLRAGMARIEAGEVAGGRDALERARNLATDQPAIRAAAERELARLSVP